jgi:hypothetical protein
MHTTDTSPLYMNNNTTNSTSTMDISQKNQLHAPFQMKKHSNPKKKNTSAQHL